MGLAKPTIATESTANDLHIFEVWPQTDEAATSSSCAEPWHCIPDEYRDFLLKQNGGAPKPNKMRPESGRVDSIEFFYSVNAKTSVRDLAKTTENYRDELELPQRYLPVALSETHDVLLLNVAGRSAGKVDWWTTISEGFSTRHVSRYCGSFSALLALLEPQVGRSRDEADFRELFLAINNGKKRDVARLLKTLDLNAWSSDSHHRPAWAPSVPAKFVRRYILRSNRSIRWY